MKLNRIIESFLCALALGSIHFSAAAASYQGYVSNVYAVNGSVFVLVNNGAFDGQPSACPTGSGFWLRADPASPFGRSLISLATAAKLTNKLVWVSGDGSCTAGGGGLPSSEGLTGFDLKG